MKKNGQLVRGTKAELVRRNLSYFIFLQEVISSHRLEKGEREREKKRERGRERKQEGEREGERGNESKLKLK